MLIWDELEVEISHCLDKAEHAGGTHLHHRSEFGLNLGLEMEPE